MTKQNQHVSGSNKRSSTSGGETDYFDLIPVDLFVNILCKLPLKSLGQCRCLSKRWSSIIRRPNYNQLFPIQSSDTPRLLFIVSSGIFSSSHEPYNLDETSFLRATRHSDSAMYVSNICPPIHGLVCRQHTDNDGTVAVISNPITGEYVTTPNVTIEGFKSNKEKFYFGYDPIEKQFKVLCMTWLQNGLHNSPGEYQVLTLGSGNLSWRKINCCILHYPHRNNGICINGVLYYQAIIDQKHLIACFDVMSEKFSFVNIDEYLERKICKPLILIDYKGKLGVIRCDIGSRFFSLSVLEDAKAHKWSDNNYKMPQMLPPCLNPFTVFSAGTIDRGEIVLYQGARHHFYIFCYNLEKNIINRVRVKVPGLDSKYQTIYAFSNFVEDDKLM